MNKLKFRAEGRRRCERKKKHLSDIAELSFFDQDVKHTIPSFIDILSENREEFIAFLKNERKGTRPMYPPINIQQAYQVEGEHLVSNIIGEKGLWLPSASQLDNRNK